MADASTDIVKQLKLADGGTHKIHDTDGRTFVHDVLRSVRKSLSVDTENEKLIINFDDALKDDIINELLD